MNLEHIKERWPGDHCLLCGANSAVIGVFIPPNAQAWGAKKGKARLFRYCLCAQCHSKPETVETVEKVIQAELSGGAISC